MSIPHSRITHPRGPTRGLWACPSSCLSLGLVLLGCLPVTTSAAVESSAAPSASAGVHADFDRFLQRQVDASGQIDYAEAQADQANRADLDRYIAWLERVSPDSHAELFPTAADQLAYWINGYNAWVIRKVLDHYPIASVRDVHPRWLFFLPRLASFFVFETITLGGVRTNLRALENKIIRKRFREPRVHFALNCASQSCPRLPTRAFTAAGLEQELTRETLRFLTDPERVRVNTDEARIEVSSIFKWYEGDFREWMARERAQEPATLQGYLASQLPEQPAKAVRDCRECRLEFIDYDWSLNDRGLRE